MRISHGAKIMRYKHHNMLIAVPRATLCPIGPERPTKTVQLYGVSEATEDNRTSEQKKAFGKMELYTFVPVMDRTRFAELTGLSDDTVRGMIKKGQIPTILVGRRRLVNIAVLTREALEQEPE